MSAAAPTPRESAPPPRAGRRADWPALLERIGPIVALLLLIAFSAAMSDAFLRPQNVLNILRQVSFVGVIAIGMTFVIILGGIDLSVGSLIAMLGGVAIWGMNKALAAGWSEPAAYSAAIAIMLLGGPVVGFLNGVLIAKGRIAPFIATLGGMAAYRSIALALADGGEFRPVARERFGWLGSAALPLPQWLADAIFAASNATNRGIHDASAWIMGWFGRGPLGGSATLEAVESGPLSINVAIVAFLLTALIGWILLGWTRYGRYVYAIGCNERAALYSAINVDRVKILTYAWIGGTCGISALLLSSRLASVSSSQMGTLYELDAIAAVVIGGTSMSGGRGRIGGTVIGVVLMGVVGNMLNLIGVGAYYQGLVKGAIIVAAVLLQRTRRGE